MRVMSARAPDCSHRGPHDNRRFDFSVRRVTDISGLLDDLGHRLKREIEKDFVHAGSSPRHCRANSYPGCRELAYRRIPESLITELLPETAGLPKIAAAWA